MAQSVVLVEANGPLVPAGQPKTIWSSRNTQIRSIFRTSEYSRAQLGAKSHHIGSSGALLRDDRDALDLYQCLVVPQPVHADGRGRGIGVADQFPPHGADFASASPVFGDVDQVDP